MTCYILAGGKSSRMGQEKAFLSLNGREMIEYAVAQARAAADETVIVGPKEKFMGYGKTIPDVFEDKGGLGGIHAALNRTSSEYNLVLGLDTPFLDAKFLKYLIQKAIENKRTVTVPRTKDGLHPLCAVYRKGFRALAEKGIQEGKLKIDANYPQGDTLVIEMESPAVKAMLFPQGMFDNINSPDDYRRAAERMVHLPPPKQ